MTKRLATLRCRVKFRWWSLQNWRKGYQFRPIQRCRRCDHTTPSHYPTCVNQEATDG